MTPNGHSYISHSEPLLRESVKAYWGEVIHTSYTDTRMRQDTAGVIHKPHASELGWVRIMVHYQGDMQRGIPPAFEGAFSVNGDVHHIMTKDNYLRTRDDLDPGVSESLSDLDSSLVVWRESDIMTAEEHSAKREMPGYMTGRTSGASQSCGHDRLDFNTDPQQNPILLTLPSVSNSWLRSLRAFQRNDSIYARDDVATGGTTMSTNFIDNIGSSDGCPTTQKVLYMGVAADCTYVATYGSQENATQQILTNWNTASSLYKSTFNVSLGIVELEVQSPSSAELEARLSLFSQWRGDKGDDGTGLWHLMSGCPTGSEVGIAWLGTLCQQSATESSSQFVSGTAVSTAGRTEWQVVAHEIGHNFGAIHDTIALRLLRAAH
ncbi:hypothetical protein H0H92_008703 [Tricholoma furcatifolium]|nr:hypothetical protein H0H92_008703 [Tricholoma furcatifolium]